MEGKTIWKVAGYYPRFGNCHIITKSPQHTNRCRRLGRQMQPRHLLGEAQGVFSTHLQRVKHEPAAHVRIVRVVGEVRHTFRVLLWLEITSRTFRRTSQLLRKNTKQKYEGTTPARGDLATKLALLTPQTKTKTRLSTSIIAKPTLLGPR